MPLQLPLQLNFFFRFYDRLYFSIKLKYYGEEGEFEWNLVSLMIFRHVGTWSWFFDLIWSHLAWFLEVKFELLEFSPRFCSQKISIEEISFLNPIFLIQNRKLHQPFPRPSHNSRTKLKIRTITIV